jgi:hypothetical protein
VRAISLRDLKELASSSSFSISRLPLLPPVHFLPLFSWFLRFSVRGDFILMRGSRFVRSLRRRRFRLFPFLSLCMALKQI